MRNNIFPLNFYFLFIWFLSFLLLFSRISVAGDIITLTQSIKDGETLVSSQKSFELGFFSQPENSKNRYLGIWYKNIPGQTIVWIANRDDPLSDSSGVLRFDDRGNLILVNQTSNIIWSSNITRIGIKNPVAQLLDSGNLIVRGETGDDDDSAVYYLWQSFDYPTDTLLPGMKLGKNIDDPSTGDYTYKMDHRGFPQAFLLNKQNPYFRSGPWNRIRYSGTPEMNLNSIFTFNFVIDQEEIYYTFVLRNEYVVSRFVLSSLGLLQTFTWNLNSSSSCNLFFFYPKDQCDTYMKCGVNGVCDTNEQSLCNCVKGFEPKYPQTYNLRNGSGGCMQKLKYECQNGDGFFKMEKMKLPESSRSFFDDRLSLEDCENECRKNCSCVAYSNSYISYGGSGCVLWVDDLIDLTHFQEGGEDLYVRVAASEHEAGGNRTNSTIDTNVNTKKKRAVRVIIFATVIPGILLLGLLSYYCYCFLRKSSTMTNKRAAAKSDKHEDDLEFELPLFHLGALTTATDDFSLENKLGKGGFGSVYKGTLSDGKQIAVKRLSKDSNQGDEEFKNEVKLIARLQHRNLVRLLGCCIEGEEKMLIYEYMQNKSLDSILFDKATSSLTLNWPKRFNIICGIARGLLYLHQDSRFRIIHRDLKGSNILLDGEMNPKISDFGIARIFRGDETDQANTKRIVGTYGYMSPEYAMAGRFSVKSDVFSFGVLVLEIVHGQKNGRFYDLNIEHTLLGHAWSLWKEGKGLDLMDASLSGDSCLTYQVLRCIHIGLLCVQERAQDRPTMSTVVFILSGDENASLPIQPKQPGFCLLPGPNGESESSSSKNQVSITVLEAR